MLTLLSTYARHKLGFLSINSLHQTAFQKIFRRVSIHALSKEVEHFLDKHFDSLCYIPALNRLLSALEDHSVILLSSSPDFLVGPIANRFGIAHWKGTEYLVDKQQKLCHIACLMDGEMKAKELISYAAQNGIFKKDITVYTDSILDLPCIEAAGNVIGVNPDRKLKRLCLKHPWEII
jgi:phosphoserine phosphatase